jgi:hypothetical protein
MVGTRHVSMPANSTSIFINHAIDLRNFQEFQVSYFIGVKTLGFSRKLQLFVKILAESASTGFSPGRVEVCVLSAFARLAVTLAKTENSEGSQPRKG